MSRTIKPVEISAIGEDEVLLITVSNGYLTAETVDKISDVIRQIREGEEGPYAVILEGESTSPTVYPVVIETVIVHKDALKPNRIEIREVGKDG